MKLRVALILRRNIMKRTNTALKLTLALLALTFATAAFAQQPPDNVQGDWTIYSTNIGNGKIETKHVQIQQYGSRIAGYFEGPKQSGPIQGRIDVHHIMFQTLTRNILTFRGQIYGDQIQGLYVLHNRRGPWQAVRTIPAAAAISPSNGAAYYSQPISTIPVTESAYSAPAQQYPAPTQQDGEPQQDSSPLHTNDSSQGSATSAPAPAPLSPNSSIHSSPPTLLFLIRLWDRGLRGV